MFQTPIENGNEDRLNLSAHNKLPSADIIVRKVARKSTQLTAPRRKLAALQSK